MAKEEDRKRLLDHFRAALEEGDALRTPSVLVDHSNGLATSPVSPVVSMPSYSSSIPPPSAPPTSSSAIMLIGGVVMILLIGVIVYLVMNRSVVPPRTGATASQPSVLGHDDDDEDDDEVIHITTGVDGTKTHADQDVAQSQMLRTQRGMPQMPQMRPGNLQPGQRSNEGGGGSTKLQQKEQDDPLFQELAEE